MRRRYEAGRGRRRRSVRVLAVNAGSTSLKIERYDLGSQRRALADPPDPVTSVTTTTDEAARALETCTREPLDAVAHRFVAVPTGSPAVFALDADARRAIEAVGSEAPLHETSALRAVEIVAGLRPGIAQFAVSDSAFHATISEAATTYAIPFDLTQSGLRRIGYHGLSHAYAAHRGCALARVDIATTRIVTAHLGGGSSLCAIRNGASIDTTMGFTPLEGIPMATRSGSVDPGLLLHLLRTGTTIDALAEMLERHSGLLGISGISGDVRELERAHDRPQARLALDVLSWRIRSAFGAMTAALGGVDLIVFTGGIGEHAAAIRASALAGGLGVDARVDRTRNEGTIEGRVDSDSSSVAIVVVLAREGWMIARTLHERRRATVTSEG